MELMRLWMADWLAWVGSKPVGNPELPSFFRMPGATLDIVALIFDEPTLKNLFRPFPDLILIITRDFHRLLIFFFKIKTGVQDKLPPYDHATLTPITLADNRLGLSCKNGPERRFPCLLPACKTS